MKTNATKREDPRPNLAQIRHTVGAASVATNQAVTVEKTANHDWRKPVGYAHSSGFAAPVVVSPKRACELLSVGLTRLYQLLNAGELESLHIGRSRRITTASISAYVDRQLKCVAAGREG